MRADPGRPFRPSRRGPCQAPRCSEGTRQGFRRRLLGHPPSGENASGPPHRWERAVDLGTAERPGSTVPMPRGPGRESSPDIGGPFIAREVCRIPRPSCHSEPTMARQSDPPGVAVPVEAARGGSTRHRPSATARGPRRVARHTERTAWASPSNRPGSCSARAMPPFRDAIRSEDTCRPCAKRLTAGDGGVSSLPASGSLGGMLLADGGSGSRRLRPG